MGNLAITTYLQAPNSVCNEVAVNGNIMQKQVFDGKQGQTVAMGQKMPMTPEEVAEMKENAQFFKEMAYLGDDYQIELSGSWQLRDDLALQLDYQYYRYRSDDWARQQVGAATVDKLLSFGEGNPNEQIHYVGASVIYRWQ